MGTEHANWPANLENVQCHLQVSFAYSSNTFVKRKFLFVFIKFELGLHPYVT